MAYTSSLNSTTLIGRLTRDPELRTASGRTGERSVLTLGIAVRKASKPDKEDTPTADFFDVTVWGEEKRRDVFAASIQGQLCWSPSLPGSNRPRGRRRTAGNAVVAQIVAGAVNFLDSPRNTNASEQQPEEAPIAA